ncbi:hypothetical protein JHK84_052455 [Glycine max]|nr:hypothetical protein JHK86_052415 [Glycine max]KAG5082417.1 hypothetical protein JHK84_052455 [Glycine max]
MARRVMGHGDAVCWFCCRDETNDMRPDAVRWFCCFFCSTLLLSMRYHEVHNKLKRSHESSMSGSGNESNSSNTNIGTSTEVKMLMMKVIAEVANASERRRKLNSIHEEGEGDGGNVELVGDVGGSSNDLVVDAFDLDNLILVKMMMHNLRKTLMMMEMGMKVMIFMEMILLEDWT